MEPATKKDELTVEEALEKKPPKNPKRVEVAWSPFPCFVNGQAKLIVAHPVQEVTVRLPILATFALRLVVEARPET